MKKITEPSRSSSRLMKRNVDEMCVAADSTEKTLHCVSSETVDLLGESSVADLVECDDSILSCYEHNCR